MTTPVHRFAVKAAVSLRATETETETETEIHRQTQKPTDNTDNTDKYVDGER